MTKRPIQDLVTIDDIGKRGVGIDSKLFLRDGTSFLASCNGHFLIKAECNRTNHHAVHVDPSAMAMFEEILSSWLGFRMFQLLHEFLDGCLIEVRFGISTLPNFVCHSPIDSDNGFAMND